MKGTTRKQRRSSGHQLFNNNPGGREPRVKGLGYGTAERARRSVTRVRGLPRGYQRQALGTLYYRAKYHKYQTNNMRAAAKVLKTALQKLKSE
jgi:hypothetical protein